MAEITFKEKIENVNSSSQWNRTRVHRKRERAEVIDILIFKVRKERPKDEGYSGGICL